MTEERVGEMKGRSIGIVYSEERTRFKNYQEEWCLRACWATPGPDTHAVGVLEGAEEGEQGGKCPKKQWPMPATHKFIDSENAVNSYVRFGKQQQLLLKLKENLRARRGGALL
jgi:hypothetical protein